MSFFRPVMILPFKAFAAETDRIKEIILVHIQKGNITFYAILGGKGENVSFLVKNHGFYKEDKRKTCFNLTTYDRQRRPPTVRV